MKYFYQQEFKLLNDVKLTILAIFPTDLEYNVDLNGIKTRLSEEVIHFLVHKFEKPCDCCNAPLEIEEEEEEIKEDENQEKIEIKETKKRKKKT